MRRPGKHSAVGLHTAAELKAYATQSQPLAFLERSTQDAVQAVFASSQDTQRSPGHKPPPNTCLPLNSRKSPSPFVLRSLPSPSIGTHTDERSQVLLHL